MFSVFGGVKLQVKLLSKYRTQASLQSQCTRGMSRSKERDPAAHVRPVWNVSLASAFVCHACADSYDDRVEAIETYPATS